MVWEQVFRSDTCTIECTKNPSTQKVGIRLNAPNGLVPHPLCYVSRLTYLETIDLAYKNMTFTLDRKFKKPQSQLPKGLLPQFPLNQIQILSVGADELDLLKLQVLRLTDLDSPVNARLRASNFPNLKHLHVNWTYREYAPGCRGSIGPPDAAKYLAEVQVTQLNFYLKSFRLSVLFTAYLHGVLPSNGPFKPFLLSGGLDGTDVNFAQSEETDPLPIADFLVRPHLRVECCDHLDVVEMLIPQENIGSIHNPMWQPTSEDLTGRNWNVVRRRIEKDWLPLFAIAWVQKLDLQWCQHLNWVPEIMALLPE